MWFQTYFFIYSVCFSAAQKFMLLLRTNYKTISEKEIGVLNVMIMPPKNVLLFIYNIFSVQ